MTEAERDTSAGARPAPAPTAGAGSGADSGANSDDHRAARAWLWRWAPWLLLSGPGLFQLGLLFSAVLGRIAYPFDLEWMEGGLLAHAARLADGHALYPPPSIEFIPYLYTPLYPALLAALGAVFDISYQLGRAVSLVSLIAALGFIAVIVVRGAGRGPDTGGDTGGDPGPDKDADTRASDDRPLAWCGAALGAGLFASAYPWVEGWYDLVRADTLFLAMVLAGLLLLARYARRGQGAPGIGGQLGVAAAAALLALSFFCKQTGIFYVAVGGLLLLCWNWRRVPIYVVTAGVIGLGGTALGNHLTDGWFWTYIFEVHQAHDFNIDRFWLSYVHILGRAPAMTAAIAIALTAVVTAAIKQRQLPAGGATFLATALGFAVSCVVGATGWGTQWAHFNAYIPAMLAGGIAAGCAIPTLAGAIRSWPRAPAWTAKLLPAGLAIALGAQLIAARWDPGSYTPTERDRDAGQALISYLSELAQAGTIYVPYHPWYARMAGQETPYTHRMGLMDLAYDDQWKIDGLRQSFKQRRFDAIILDNRPPGWEFPSLRRYYRLDEPISGAMQPRLYTGAKVVPAGVWVPIDQPPPEGARAVFDFESGHLRGWDKQGSAWGQGPVRRPLPKQGQVSRYRGRAYLSSMHRGDANTGRLTSPSFALLGDGLSVRMSGGADPDALRVEVHLGRPPHEQPAVETSAAPADDLQPNTGAAQSTPEPIFRASNDINSERMREVRWDISAHRGQRAYLVLIDDATDSWGHLNVDDVLLWSE